MWKIYYREWNKVKTIEFEPKDYEKICKYLNETWKKYMYCTKLNKKNNEKSDENSQNWIISITTYQKKI